MAKTIKIVNGYQGKLTREFFLPAGAVIEVENEVAEQLIENGHAKAASGAATHGLTGPITDGAEFVPATPAATTPPAETGAQTGNPRKAQLETLKMSEVEGIAKGHGLTWRNIGMSKKGLIGMILDKEGYAR